MREHTQILVVGGGPAGSTAAGLLAKQGFEVTLLERDRFPRYHIGESILPSCRPIFELLGVWEKIEAHGFQPKGGAFFFWGEEEWEVRFSDMGDATNAWQVRRAEFDKILLDHARELGVEVLEETGVSEIEFAGGRPVAARWQDAKDEAAKGRITFDYVIDASGRNGVLAARQFNSRKFHDIFKNMAAWTYWKNAKPLPKGPEGAIGVASMPNGWFWIIPMGNDITSVGLVTGRDHFLARKAELGGVEQVYSAAVADQAVVKDILDGAEQTADFKVEADYSYAAESFCGPGFMLAGDAACFLDPLLSTGVHLATYSGMLAAASLGSTLRGEATEEEAWAFYQKVYRHAYERLLVLVSVFYESYRGKDYHFYNAQKLSSEQRDELDLQAAFDRIITGIEDLNDAQDVYAAVHGHLNGAESGDPIPLNNLNRVHEAKQAPLNEEQAVAGLYLSFFPQLGLKRAGENGAAQKGAQA